MKDDDEEEEDPVDAKDEADSVLESIPTILFTFFQNPEKYKTMFQFMVSDIFRGTFRVVPIRIDEKLFIQFTRECYYHRWVGETANALKKKEKMITVSDVRTYLSKYRGLRKGKTEQSQTAKKYRMPTQREIKVSCRHLLWTLNYWQNSSRGTGSYPRSPILQYKDLPFYGWVQDSELTCRLATAVSPFVPLDTEFVRLLTTGVEGLTPQGRGIKLLPKNKNPPKNIPLAVTKMSIYVEDSDE